MIFVTVGTHEQQFDRLIQEVDRLKKENLIQDEVFIQTGYSNYIPKYCEWEKIISYEKMNQMIEESDIIITHGGPATFMGVIAKGKVPIVVPRQKKFGEHVNDHQLEFCNRVKENYPIKLIKETSDIIEKINDVDSKTVTIKNNNEKFCRGLIELLQEI